jgi:protein phosphatase
MLALMSAPIRPDDDHPPFDLVGDVHGCLDELLELLTALGYREVDGTVEHPDRRRVVLLGDLVDRGPDTPGILRLAMRGAERGTVLSVIGNHDDKLRRALLGHNVQVKNGLERSLDQLRGEPEAFCSEVVAFLDSLPSHLILDRGHLVAAHAGLPLALIGREDARTRDVAMFGPVTGRTDEDGLPERLNWAAEHPGDPIVAYGHTPVLEPLWQNGTIDVDTGCTFGGRLTAVSYPERSIVSVPARRAYAEKGGPYRIGWPGGERTTLRPTGDAAAN